MNRFHALVVGLSALTLSAAASSAQTMRASCDNRQGRSFADVVDSSDPNESSYNVDPSEIYRSFNAIPFPNSQTSGGNTANASLTVNSRFLGTNPGASSNGFIMNNAVSASATRVNTNVLAFANDTTAVCFDVAGASAGAPRLVRVIANVTTQNGATARFRLQNPASADLVNITTGSFHRVLRLTTNGTHRFTGTLDTGSVQPASGSLSRSATLAAAIVCPADVNGSGDLTVQDVFDFLAFYFAGNLAADMNGSGTLTVQDIFDFLARYFAGC